MKNITRQSSVIKTSLECFMISLSILITIHSFSAADLELENLQSESQVFNQNETGEEVLTQKVKLMQLPYDCLLIVVHHLDTSEIFSLLDTCVHVYYDNLEKKLIHIKNQYALMEEMEKDQESDQEINSYNTFKHSFYEYVTKNIRISEKFIAFTINLLNVVNKTECWKDKTLDDEQLLKACECEKKLQTFLQDLSLILDSYSNYITRLIVLNPKLQEQYNLKKNLLEKIAELKKSKNLLHVYNIKIQLYHEKYPLKNARNTFSKTIHSIKLDADLDPSLCDSSEDPTIQLELLHQFHALKNFQIRDSFEMIPFIKYLPNNLEYLSCNYCNFSYIGICNLEHLESLNRLDLSKNKFNEYDFLKIIPTSITHLEIISPESITQEAINSLSRLENLKTLVLSAFPGTDWTFLSQLSPSITHLDLSRNTIPDTFFSHLSHLIRVETINLNNVSIPSGDQLDSSPIVELSKLPVLKTLLLRNIEGSISLPHTGFRNFNQLEHLDLRNARGINIDYHFITSLPKSIKKVLTHSNTAGLEEILHNSSMLIDGELIKLDFIEFN